MSTMPSTRSGNRVGPFVLWSLSALACVLSTVAVLVWFGPSRLSDSSAAARANSVLTTMATLSGAAVVLALTATLVGFQMSSRFGTRASRMVTTRPVGLCMAGAALLGVGAPLLAAAEPWPWMRTVGFACFSWTVLLLGIAASRTLAHLDSQWLAVHCVCRLLRDLEGGPGETRVASSQSILLEIAAGAAEGDPGGHAARRAAVFAGLMGYRLGGEVGGLSELTESLAARAAAASRRGDSPLPTAEILSLIGLVGGDADVALGTLRLQSDLVQESVLQHRAPVVRSVLDEAAGFASDRLHAILGPTSIAWLEEQEPVGRPSGLYLFVDRPQDAEPVEETPLPIGRNAVLDWVGITRPASRQDVRSLAALLPVAPEPPSSAEPEAEPVEVTMVEPPDVLGIRIDDDRAAFLEQPEEQVVIADLAEYLRDGTQAGTAEGDEAATDEDRRRARAMRGAEWEAGDLLEAAVEAFMAAAAAPRPEDAGWPGGWRGSGEFAADMRRLAAPSISLYDSGRFPPTDRPERAIEELVGRALRRRDPRARADERADSIGWRTAEAALQRSAVWEGADALRELAVGAWNAGYARRALLTVRRLVALFVTAVEQGDAQWTDDLADAVRLSVVRTSQSADGTIAERARSRQLVLALAPDFAALGRAIGELEGDDRPWEAVAGVLDTVGWSPRGSASEAAAEVSLHYLAGFGTRPDDPEFDRPWNAVASTTKPSSRPAPLSPGARHYLLHELRMSGTSEQPRLAVLVVLALWRDAIADGSPARAEEVGRALRKHVLDLGRRDYEPDALWVAEEGARDRPPRSSDEALVHWRVFDVTMAASHWIDAAKAGGNSAPVLPPVETPDADLFALIGDRGAQSLVDERDYWGVEHDDELVLVQEADRSRRLLRDCECKARSKVNWGYSGTGPDDLAEILVADALGPLAYCPSCFGTIGIAAGLIECPVCEHGMRPDLWKLHRACDWLTSLLSQVPVAQGSSVDAPPGAQWHIRRTDLLDFIVSQASEFEADDD
ncbi:MAG: hypothetical protein ACHQFZ_10770 [Acidimicrobiales bacterium]